MWKEIEKYYQTLKYLKKSQFFYLLRNRMERNKKAVTMMRAPEVRKLHLWSRGLDEHPQYLKRFDLQEILEGRVTLLYESGEPGGKNWAVPDKSHLWNFNLHYLEFLIPLAAAYRCENEERYYECFRTYCRRWIEDNAEGTGDGWHPYTISLRLTNLWICMDGLGEILQKDQGFFQELNNSMYAQYCHLQKTLELHLLGNHYFENLKAVLLGAGYFQESLVYQNYKKKFVHEIREQILPDGVHYERSMMYHKIILEDFMRVAKALKSWNRENRKTKGNTGLETIMQRMADAVCSLEEGMGRTPLFNDSGDNVARPLECLQEALQEEFQIVPRRRQSFPCAGYYCLRGEGWKLVFDAGEIAPDYMPGHGHCDGLSFELSRKGRPLFVNAGTGLYQGNLRSYFRSTAAHNTVVIDGEEQSECWGEHRVGRRMTAAEGECGNGWVQGSLTTCSGKQQKRRLELKEGRLQIWDLAPGSATGYFHLAPEYQYKRYESDVLVLDRAGQEICRIKTEPGDRMKIHRKGDGYVYAPEFGKMEPIQVLEIVWDGKETGHMIQIQFG